MDNTHSIICEVLVSQAECFYQPATIKYAARGLLGENLVEKV